MSLEQAANYLQSHGRGKDTMLVHMSPREVGGLQALAAAHGGSLTTNPSTGLQEAGFLEDILPMIAGVALNAFVPGLGAVASGLLAGGATAAITGDLEKGLSAGLGAFGGASLAGSLAGAGAKGAASAGVNALDDVALQGARAGKDISSQLWAANPAQIAQQPLQISQQAQGLGGMAQQGLGAAARQGMQQQLATGANRFNQMGQGLSQIASDPNQAGQFLRQNIVPIGAAAMPLLNNVSGNQQGAEEEYDPTNPFLKRRLSPRFRGFVPPQPNYVRFAEGGRTDMPRRRGLAALPQSRLAPPAMYFGEGKARDFTNTSGMRADQAAQKIMEDAHKRARIEPKKAPKTNPIALSGGGGLGLYSDGGNLLKGPGDGMSDDIPASINGTQGARLTDGEFVVPADVVSGIGNGSTDAGARKLYSMMDKVRHGRTGRKKQAPAINSDRILKGLG